MGNTLTMPYGKHARLHAGHHIVRALADLQEHARALGRGAIVVLGVLAVLLVALGFTVGVVL